MKTLRVELAERSYPVCIGRGVLFEAGELISSVTDAVRLAVVTDENVEKQYGELLTRTLSDAGYETTLVTLSAGEGSKTFASLQQILEHFAAAGLTRADAVLAFGGGVVGDLAGFAAAVYCRGVDLIEIPTTLLAQVDSAIGGKTAVNLRQGKNLAGVFHQPRLVLIDTNLTDTLPEREKSAGMAEVIKYAMIGDAEMFRLLENCGAYRFPMESVIYRCCAMKAAFVAADERDTGARRALNFGHTFGHAYERAYGYEAYSHGEAVAAGMMKMLELCGVEGPRRRLSALLEKYNLPTEIPCLIESMEQALRADKKHVGTKLTVVEVPEIGTFSLRETTVEDLLQRLAEAEETPWTF